MEKQIISTKVLTKKSVLGKIIDRTLRARSTDLTRYFLTLGYWDHDNKALVATDGRRLHILQGGDINDLFSDITENCFIERQGDMVILYDKSFGQFPNWQRVTPPDDTLQKIESIELATYTSLSLPLDLSDKKLFSKNIAYCFFALNAAFQLEYMQDLIGGQYDLYKVCDGDKHRAHKLVEDNRSYTFTAVLMPLQPIERIF
jgi:hypothetical protein